MKGQSHKVFFLTLVCFLIMITMPIPISPAAELIIAVNDYGAVGDGNTDDTAAIQQALDALKATGGTLIFSPSTNYRVNGQLTISDLQNDIVIEGNGSTLNGRTASIPSSYFFNIYGKSGTITPLTTDIKKGSTKIVFPVAVNQGEYYLLKSTDLFNQAGTKGEIVHVISAEGDLAEKTYDGYNHSTTTCQKITMPSVQVKNLRVINNANVTGLRVAYARNVVVDASTFIGNRVTGCTVQYSVDVLLQNNHTDDNYYINSGTSYGLSIASCQRVREIGNTCFSGRHGIAHGGWIPFRDITIEGNYISNTVDPQHSSQTALDFHANSGGFINVKNNNLVRGTNYTGGESTITFSNNHIGYMVDVNLETDAGTIALDNNTMNLENGFWVRQIYSGIYLDQLVMNNNDITTANTFTIGNYNKGRTFKIGHITIENCKIKGSQTNVKIGCNWETARNTKINSLQFIDCDLIIDTSSQTLFAPLSFLNADIGDVSLQRCNFYHYQGPSMPWACFTSFSNASAKNINATGCTFESKFYNISNSPVILSSSLVATNSIIFKDNKLINLRKQGTGFVLKAPNVTINGVQIFGIIGTSPVTVDTAST